MVRVGLHTGCGDRHPVSESCGEKKGNIFRVNNKQKEEKNHGIKAVRRGDVSTFTHFIIIKSSLHRKGRKGLVEKV